MKMFLILVAFLVAIPIEGQFTQEELAQVEEVLSAKHVEGHWFYINALDPMTDVDRSYVVFFPFPVDLNGIIPSPLSMSQEAAPSKSDVFSIQDGAN